MTKLDIAYVREQGQTMIIVPLDGSFDHKTPAQQNAAEMEIQAAARSAGLAGTVVLFWPSGSRLKFKGPKPWHPFLEGITLDWIQLNINRSLSW